MFDYMNIIEPNWRKRLESALTSKICSPALMFELRSSLLIDSSDKVALPGSRYRLVS